MQGLIVISSGFADKDEAGERLEHDLVTLARRHGMRLIGPNCLGVINTSPDVRLHATFADVDPLPGRIGSVRPVGHDRRRHHPAACGLGPGISSFVAVGNKADVSGNDLLRYWQDDDRHRRRPPVPGVVRQPSQVQPHRPRGVAGQADRGREGRPRRGRGRAEPVGWPSDASVGAMLDQSGVIRVDTLTQMFHTASVLARQPLPAGPRVAVLTNSWGPAFLATDALQGAGLVLAEPSEVTRKALDALVPDGPAPPTRSTCPTAPPRRCSARRSGSSPPIPTSTRCSSSTRRGINAEYAEVSAAVLRGAADGAATGRGLPARRSPHRPARRRHDGGARVPVPGGGGARARPGHGLRDLAGDAGGRRARARRGRRRACSCARRRRARGPPRRCAPRADSTPTASSARPASRSSTSGVVDGVDDAVAAARELGYPVAVKAGGLVQLSRTEAGGVSLDVHGDDEVRRAHTRMTELLGAAMSPTVVQRMLPEGLECRIGLHRHPVLGDVISLGAGGSVAEQFDGLALHILPLTDCDADRLITAATIGSAVDALGPGGPPALADVLLRLSALAECVPEIAGVASTPCWCPPTATPRSPTSASTSSPSPPTPAPRSAASVSRRSAVGGSQRGGRGDARR